MEMKTRHVDDLSIYYRFLGKSNGIGSRFVRMLAEQRTVRFLWIPIAEDIDLKACLVKRRMTTLESINEDLKVFCQLLFFTCR